MIKKEIIFSGIMEERSELPMLFYAYRRKLVGNVPAHSHGGCELIYLLKGSCRVESPLGVLEGGEEHLLVIPPETVHNQIDSPDEKNIFCVFQTPPGLFEQRWREIDLTGEAWCRRLLLELADMTERNDFEGANAILLGLLQRITAFERKQSAVEHLHPRLLKALTFIYHNFSHNISVKQIAEASGSSVSLLRKLFVDYCGVSPLRYLQDLRISRAEEMLKNPYLSISEIALKCGYENPGYFIRLYRRKYGVSPGRSRRPAR